MTSIRKVLSMSIFLFVIIALFTLVGFYLGHDGLILVGDIDLPIVVYGIINFIVFAIQFILLSCIILSEYSKKIFKIAIPYLIAYFVSVPFFSGYLKFIPTSAWVLYLLVWAIIRKDLKQSTKRALKISLFVMVFEFVELIVKAGQFTFGYNVLNQYQWLIYSIDLIIFITFLFAIGGEKHYELLGLAVRRSRWERILCPEQIEDALDDAETSAELKIWQAMKGFARIRAMSLLLGFQLMQWTIILFVCFISNVFIEGLVITASFICHGFIIKRRWHSNSLIVCTLVSAAIFYVASHISISFQYSQLFPVVIGLVLIYSLYRVALLTDAKNNIINVDQKEINKIDKLEQNIDIAWHRIDEIEEQTH